MNELQINAGRRKRRSLVPILIIAIAGGLFLWGQSRKDSLTRTVASTFESAALDVCDRESMPNSIHWTVPGFKEMFIRTIRPACDGNDPDLLLNAHAIEGDGQDPGGNATHRVTIQHGAVALLRLRVHTQDESLITVIGWSKP